MGYDAAALSCVVHLHFLHVLHLLLAHRHHRVCLRQQNDGCMIEHSCNDSGSLDQPVTVSMYTSAFDLLETYQTSGNRDLEVC